MTACPSVVFLRPGILDGIFKSAVVLPSLDQIATVSSTKLLDWLIKTFFQFVRLSLTQQRRGHFRSQKCFTKVETGVEYLNYTFRDEVFRSGCYGVSGSRHPFRNS